MDFNNADELEKKAQEGLTDDYMPKILKKGSFAERKASGIKRSTVDYSQQQYNDLQEIADYLKIPVQAAIKLAIHEFVIRHKTTFKKSG